MGRFAVAPAVARCAVARCAVARLAGAVLGGALVVTATGCGGESERTGFAVVTAVVDGDTIDVRIGGRDERVRLIGIDTPEVARPGSPAECHGPEASAFTAELLPIGSRVRIERDVVGRDHFGRLLGYVHLVADDRAADRSDDRAGDQAADRSDDRASDDLFVNLEIVERGHATPLTIEPNERHAGAFTAAARRAEAADLGLWAACNQIASPR